MRTRIALIIIALTTIASIPAIASAATTYHLAAQRIGSDSFDNYDFLSKNVSSTNVDWPVNMLFRNNAEVDKVKEELGWAQVASEKFGRLNNSFGWFYDSDSGVKSNICPVFSSAVHMRVYADPDRGDRSYTPSLGYYVLGTSHYDRLECSGPAGDDQFGWSELAEQTLGSSYSVRGWTIYRSLYDMGNKETPRQEGKHYWNNDGLATIVDVP